MKKILSTCLMIICCFVLAGCSECTYTVEYKNNGQIVQSFQTKINKEELELNGFSYQDLIATIKNLYANYWANKQSSMLSNLNNNQGLTVSQRTKIFESVVAEVEVIENSLKLSITYPSSQVANLVNTDPQQDTQNSDNAYKHTWYTTTLIQDVTNIYNGYEETELYKQLYEIYCANGVFTEQDLSLYQVIAFSSSRYKSNAQQIVKKNNLYYHVWNISDLNKSDNANNQQLKIYLTTAKPLAWYLTAVAITVSFIVVSFIVVTKNKKTIKNT